MNGLEWLYWNIPNWQLQGERVNIVGALWLVLMGLYTFTILSNIHPFKSKKYTWIFLFNMVASFIIAKFIHQYIDNFFMLGDLLTGHPEMLSNNDPEWNWTVFYLSWSWLFIFSTLTMNWFWKVYDLKKHLRFNWITVLTSCLIVIFWTIHLTLYPYDYAVLEGAPRVNIFWRSYVPLYLFYGVFYVSLWIRPHTPLFPLETIKDYYIQGEEYDWVKDPRGLERIFHSRREKATVDFINKQSKNSKILDVGCGTGRITRNLHGEVIGLDINEWNLGRAKINAPNVEKWIQGDCEDMKAVQDGSIDTVVFTETLEHLQDPKRALQEIHRVLKPNGKLIVSVPSKSWIWKLRSILTTTHPHSEPFHKNYSERTLRKLLIDSGFNYQWIHTKSIVFGMTLIGVCDK